MKFVIITFAIFVAAVLSQEQEKYIDKYDSLDIDEILGNKRLMSAYVKCMLDQGKCTAEGKLLKSHVADALQTGCAKCTDAQEKGMRKVIHHLIHQQNDAWQNLVLKYDPRKVYMAKYRNKLNSVMQE